MAKRIEIHMCDEIDAFVSAQAERCGMCPEAYLTDILGFAIEREQECFAAAQRDNAFLSSEVLVRLRAAPEHFPHEYLDEDPGGGIHLKDEGDGDDDDGDDDHHHSPDLDDYIPF